MSDLPVRLCCGQRHAGPICPDGLVMCCLCFERVPVTALSMDDDGHVTDVCLRCKSEEDAAMAPDPVDLPELRRLAKAAKAAPPNQFGLTPWFRHDDLVDGETAVVVSPDVVLDLLDRIDALEARVERYDRIDLADVIDAISNAYRRTAYPGQMVAAADAVLALLAPPLADPGAVAGEPESEETT